ncbi:UDP-N-acetyl glucosamine 2-epimerase [Leucobacter denitrificans]|uniref:UDP-N-acetylglucosamine 2-epimerase n=2 Tax=Leucobacter denitrificans TaxID=683042 RepID=A0A7G9S7B0_9MICO|nr:UDP-N-acetylglucosamine 2-epimerase [Leucobacter denitrificans]QNN63735.1 UDP-N-acetylglucosamine 2-epimerase [Leucobacter denitrificans]
MNAQAHGSTPIIGGTREPVHVVLVGTKPDIIKQAPVYHELVARGHHAIVCHTGQHYSHNLSGSMLEEFNIRESVNLGVSGSAIDVTSGVSRKLADYLTELDREVGPPITYAHGDTATAMSGSLAAFGLGQGLVHVEAGLRTLSPIREVLHEWHDRIEAGSFDFQTFKAQHLVRANFGRGSREPSPEQFNTRVVDAGAQFHAAPVELNREYLLEDGFDPKTIAVVGNSIVDALQTGMTETADQELLERFPAFASGEFIRYCVHRKENTENRARFTALMDGMEELLEGGHSVLFIRLNGTESAIDRFGMREWLNELEARHGDRLISTPVWDNYSHVLAAMQRCALIATDSGSIQEEVNVLGVPCVTLRFGSDRGESLLAGGNFLAPPTRGDLIAEVIRQVFAHRGEISWERIYPENASTMLVEEVEARLDGSGLLPSSEEWRYGL